MQDVITATERLTNIMNHPTHECRRCNLAHSNFRDARDCCYEEWFKGDSHEKEESRVSETQ